MTMTDTRTHTSTEPESDLAGRHIHFVGIGGCGMSGLARMMHAAGAHCSGTDAVPTDLTSSLSKQGIAVTHDQDHEWLPDECHMVIVSAAIRPDHPQLLAAQGRGITVLTYAEALGMLQSTRTGVSIAGTHGKSTTTAMLAHVLIEADLDPGFVVGAQCPQIGGGARTGAVTVPGHGPFAGRPAFLMAEACEFNRSFHHHRPTLALINNVEADHLDIYGSLDEVVRSFAEFARLVPPAAAGGRLLIGHDGAHRREITAGLTCDVSTFGFNPAADYHVQFDPASLHVSVSYSGRTLAEWTMHMPGEHNASNAAAAGILASWCGVSGAQIGRSLGSFKGLERRLQRLGSRAVPGGEVTVYDDYGHHPTEVDATLRALRQSHQPSRLICVFQPHQHSRTRFLLEEFAHSFEQADVVIVPHIYFVRDSEAEKQRISAADLVDRLRLRGVTAMHLYPFEAIVEQLEVICRPGDLVVIMGAGPVWKVGHAFLGLSVAT